MFNLKNRANLRVTNKTKHTKSKSYLECIIGVYLFGTYKSINQSRKALSRFFADEKKAIINECGSEPEKFERFKEKKMTFFNLIPPPPESKTHRHN